jgi:hypothetical protein
MARNKKRRRKHKRLIKTLMYQSHIVVAAIEDLTRALQRLEKPT